jgi:predicted xylose isomerase-like sugar epimerase
MTRGTIGVTVKKFFAMGSVANRLSRRLNLNAAQIRDDLPNLIVGHADALAVRAVGGHDGAGDALADVLEQIGVCVTVTFVRSSEIGAAAAAASAEAVAEGAVDAELEFARLGGFCVA